MAVGAKDLEAAQVEFQPSESGRNIYKISLYPRDPCRIWDKSYYLSMGELIIDADYLYCKYNKLISFQGMLIN